MVWILQEYSTDDDNQCAGALFSLQAQQHLLETQELNTQVTELEDKLADAKLENTKLKNEIIDQKTNFEIQLCDLQTKVNEVGDKWCHFYLV